MFNCPFCGQSLWEEWYHKSAYCWGGNGSRYHRYKYPGLNVMILTEKTLPPTASYAVHWKQRIYFTDRNILNVVDNDLEYSLPLSDDLIQRFIPVLIPPFLYLIPIATRDSIKKLNILSIKDHMSGNINAAPEIIDSLVSVKCHPEIHPAVWFKPADPMNTGRLAFWEQNELKLMDVSNDSLYSLYQAEGLLDNPRYAPCFDDNGDLWLTDNDDQSLVFLKLGQEGLASRESFPYRGIMSAPIVAEGMPHFYLTNNANTDLVCHREGAIMRSGRNITEVQPPHISRNPDDHPQYLLEAKLEGVSFSPNVPIDLQNSLHPLWIDRNGVNAMFLIHQ